MGFVGSDLWKVRQKWGSGPLVWPGVTVIPLNRDGKVWMGKRADNGEWSIVGGYYELGDDAEACARREVREELGLEIDELTMIGVITDPKITHIVYPNGDQVQSPSHVFVAKVADGVTHDDDEHTAHVWVSLDEAAARNKGAGMGYTTTGLKMYAAWLATGQFQVT